MVTSVTKHFSVGITSKSFYLRTLLSAFLIYSVSSNAEIYKWIDDEGNVHFGDSPPEEANAEVQQMPQFPSEEEIEKATAELESTLDARRAKESKATSSSDQPSTYEVFPQHEIFEVTDCNSSYFSKPRLSPRDPISELYNNGPGYGSLSTEQAKLVRALYSKMSGNWRGEYIELDCNSKSLEGQGVVGKGIANVKASWDRPSNRLTLQSDVGDFPDTDSKKFTFYFGVTDYLYYRDREGYQLNDDRPKILAEGNRVNLFRLADSDIGFSLTRTHTRKSWAPGHTRQLTQVTGGINQTNMFRVSSTKLDIVVRYPGNAIGIWRLRK